MAMETVNQENVFVGATVLLGSMKLFVYKVNAKSLYVGETDSKVILEKWESKPLGEKWVGFMNRLNGKKVSYSGLKISSEEVSRKEGFLKIKEARNSMKDWLGKSGRKLMKDLAVLDKKGKNIAMTRRDFGNHQLFVIVVHPEKNGQFLIRLDRAYLFYNVNTQVYTRFDKEIHKNGKTVVFPDLIVPTEVKVAM
jgi:hypothetical protein